jgi:hypothetical protein
MRYNVAYFEWLDRMLRLYEQCALEGLRNYQQFWSGILPDLKQGGLKRKLSYQGHYSVESQMHGEIRVHVLDFKKAVA